MEVADSGALGQPMPQAASPAATPGAAGEPVPTMLAGTVFKILVAAGDEVAEGDGLVVIEAMKMETQISAPRAGKVGGINVRVGDAVGVGDTLVTLS